MCPESCRYSQRCDVDHSEDEDSEVCSTGREGEAEARAWRGVRGGHDCGRGSVGGGRGDGEDEFGGDEEDGEEWRGKGVEC